MLAWIGTRLFYAALFFLIGVWAATVSPRLRHLVHRSGDVGAQSVEQMKIWTNSTLASTERSLAPSPEPATKPAPAAPAGATTEETKRIEAARTASVAAARAAYARGDATEAINLYRAVLKDNPDDVAARGELGNIYFASGRRRDAAQIYHEAALISLAHNDVANARKLAPAIAEGDSSLGADIYRRLSSVH
ncbi:MAG: tetratricopeptide repeat protein [Hyphomicrobiales bacterium]|nr:tetratricopeptide repeat protein [Hyphomicrobiales bacterium]